MFSNRLPEMKDRRTSPVSQVIGRKPSALVGFGALVILILITCLSFASPLLLGLHTIKGQEQKGNLWQHTASTWAVMVLSEADLVNYGEDPPHSHRTCWPTPRGWHLHYNHSWLWCVRGRAPYSERRSDSSSLWIGWPWLRASPWTEPQRRIFLWSYQCSAVSGFTCSKPSLGTFAVAVALPYHTSPYG